MSKLTSTFTCPQCGRVDTQVVAIIDGRRDDEVRTYPNQDYPSDNCADWFGPDSKQALECAFTPPEQGYLPNVHNVPPLKW